MKKMESRPVNTWNCPPKHGAMEDLYVVQTSLPRNRLFHGPIAKYHVDLGQIP